MIAGVADTHAALWYLLKNPRLSKTARVFSWMIWPSVGNTIALSAVSLAEIVYLVEKNRLPESAYHDLKTVLQDTDYVIEEASFTTENRRSHAAGISRREYRTCPTAS